MHFLLRFVGISLIDRCLIIHQSSGTLFPVPPSVDGCWLETNGVNAPCAFLSPLHLCNYVAVCCCAFQVTWWFSGCRCAPVPPASEAGGVVLLSGGVPVLLLCCVYALQRTRMYSGRFINHRFFHHYLLSCVLFS